MSALKRLDIDEYLQAKLDRLLDYDALSSQYVLDPNNFTYTFDLIDSSDDDEEEILYSIRAVE